MTNPVLWFQVLGKEAQALRDSYRGVFGWTIGEGDTSNRGDYGYVESGSGGIPGGIGSGSDRSLSHAAFYVEVQDQDAVLAQAGEFGGRIIKPPASDRAVTRPRKPQSSAPAVRARAFRSAVLDGASARASG